MIADRAEAQKKAAALIAVQNGKAEVAQPAEHSNTRGKAATRAA